MESSIKNSNDSTNKVKSENVESNNKANKPITPNIEITSTDTIDNYTVETNEDNDLAFLSLHSYNSPNLTNTDEYRRFSAGDGGSNSPYMSVHETTASMYRSMTSLSGDDDPWKASSIGIKCVSYKPVGFILLSRRILDLYTTDGSHKIEIFYSYSKKFRNKIKIPSIGSSMQNCSFCDTITLDFVIFI